MKLFKCSIQIKFTVPYSSLRNKEHNTLMISLFVLLSTIQLLFVRFE